jgi:hypothetical protein
MSMDVFRKRVRNHKKERECREESQVRFEPNGQTAISCLLLGKERLGRGQVRYEEGNHADVEYP